MIDDLQAIKRKIEHLISNALDYELKEAALKQLHRILDEVEGLMENEELKERPHAMQQYRNLLDAYERGEYDDYLDENDDEQAG